MKELLNKLTHTFGPSGYERQVRELILENIKEYADEYKVDALGNLLVRKGTKKANGKRIMISAHMDEIGLMITHIDEDGFAYAAPIGGINPLNCVSARVVFENGGEGTVQTFEPRSTGRTSAMEKLYIDTGKSPENVIAEPNNILLHDRRIRMQGRSVIALVAEKLW